jgi:hypothetical protein
MRRLSTRNPLPRPRQNLAFLTRASNPGIVILNAAKDLLLPLSLYCLSSCHSRRESAIASLFLIPEGNVLFKSSAPVQSAPMAVQQLYQRQRRVAIPAQPTGLDNNSQTPQG